MRHAHMGLCLPCYLAILFRLLSYMCVLQEASTVLGFNTAPQMALVLLSFLIFSFLLCSPCFILPMQPLPSPIHNSLFCLSFLGETLGDRSVPLVP